MNSCLKSKLEQLGASEERNNVESEHTMKIVPTPQDKTDQISARSKTKSEEDATTR